MSTRQSYASQHNQDAAYDNQQKQQQSTRQFTATLNNIKRVDKYDYLGVVLNNDMSYDAQWEVTSSKTNPHILKKLRRMGFTKDKIVCIYKSLILGHYIYANPI